MAIYKRHIAKAVTYRLLGTFQTCLISYFFTGDFFIAGSIGLVEITIKPLLYILHESIWHKYFKFGINSSTNKTKEDKK